MNICLKMQFKYQDLFSKGKRSIIYLGEFQGKKVAIKEQRNDTDAMDVAQKEASWLRIVNTKHIGPKLLHAEKNIVIYEFVDGTPLDQWIETHSKQEIIIVLNNLLKQCYELDMLNISKQEMHNPYKHILVTKNNRPVMIDFERTKKTLAPKNLTQFCQYLTKGSFAKKLQQKGIHLNVQQTKTVTQNYKKNLKKLITIKELYDTR